MFEMKPMIFAHVKSNDEPALDLFYLYNNQLWAEFFRVIL